MGGVVMKSRLILALGSLLLASCETTTPPTPYVGLTHAAFKLDVSDPGALHNEIAAAYATRRGAVADRPITRKEFVRFMVDSANEVLMKEELPAIVTPADINRVIDEIHTLRRRNVFDFFSYTPGEPVGIVDDWEERGIIPHAEADDVRKELLGEDSNSSSRAIWAFRSVYNASMGLWTDADFTRKIKTVDQMLKRLDGETPPDKSKTAYEMDSIGALFGWFLGGPLGSLIGSSAFSWAYYECPPADMGTWESPGYYIA